ncbi:testican-2 isoform X2 [Narcine bancroftii]|uniref:testican-2 isoform X2 n=1 Tax=Narcine bancroftii TaxID=1343680 RepID=UPI003831887D
MLQALNLLPLLLLAVAGKESPEKGGKNGNLLEDEQWLSSVSPYSQQIRNWNRFRDDDYIRTWDQNQVFDEALDPTKDPCQKVKCSRHKICISQGQQRAMCISRKKLQNRIKQSSMEQVESPCKSCKAVQMSPICGSDGHTYSSQCKLELQVCLTGKQLTLQCEGKCPCPTERTSTSDPANKPAGCTGQDLADLGDRLRDWFQLLHENAKQNSSGRPTDGVSEKSLVPSCRDSVGWMFSKLDTDTNMFLDETELGAINLDKYEVCVRPFFNSCDTYRDGQVSMAEWCFCFWREKPPCLVELEKIQLQEAAQKVPGVQLARHQSKEHTNRPSKDRIYKNLEKYSLLRDCLYCKYFIVNKVYF